MAMAQSTPSAGGLLVDTAAYPLCSHKHERPTIVKDRGKTMWVCLGCGRRTYR